MYTREENNKRKEVFDYISKRYANSWKYEYKQHPLYKFGKSNVVRNAIIDANKRNEYSKPYSSMLEQYKESIKTRAANLAGCLPSSGYSMGELRTIKVMHLGIISEYDDRASYVNRKWTPRHGEVSVTLPISIVARAEDMQGIITIKGKKVQNGIYHAQWVEWDYERNGRGIITTNEIGYHLVSGYVTACGCVNNPNSMYYYHASSLSNARAILAKRKILLKRDAILEKKYINAEKERASGLKRLTRLVNEAIEHEYTYNDSIESGNCNAGTTMFARNNNLDIESKCKGSVLLRLAEKSHQTYNIYSMLKKRIETTHPKLSFGVYVWDIDTIVNNLKKQ